MKYVRKIKPFFKDERGELSHLLNSKKIFTSALLITCKKGAIRANHYHKKDTHYSFMVKGKMEYTYKPLSSKNRARRVTVNTDEIVETPPMTLHAMKFLEDSVFIAFTTEERDQKKYEKDTVRVKLVE